MAGVGSTVPAGGVKQGGTAPRGNVVVPNAEELEWVTIKSQLEAAHQNESLLMRRFKENPFVPIGCIFTACVLTYGIYSFSKGRSKMSQKMMRLRIVAQGATLVALVGGVMMGAGQKI
ncbi:HIG1 domain family member 1A, mitochondrial [Arctopsyche grandis]|uniref:HIG1 domain family member 1A, mitochondrial n=1 Tax=Arctopsyche grandis TaxID=121162 RepID=UPI00406D76F2